MTCPWILGILNLTPDSFSDGGEFLHAQRALEQARRLVAEGSTHLDVGAESTRPGAAPVSEEEEWSRLEPVLRRLQSELPRVPWSLDTRHAGVATRALGYGPSLLNDVTGLTDPAMVQAALSFSGSVIAMRSRRAGDAFHMPPYEGPGATSPEDAVRELRALRDRLLAAGLPPERILLDPGFGFGTTWTEDRALWAFLPQLPEALDWPVERICLGISRKRFTAWMAGDPALPPQARDGITRQLHTHARTLGYRVFRTHALPCFTDGP